MAAIDDYAAAFRASRRAQYAEGRDELSDGRADLRIDEECYSRRSAPRRSGVRDPASPKTAAALEASAGATATSPAEAVEGADVVAFTLRWDAIPKTIASLPSLAGRIVIDAMNRFDGDPGRSTTQDLEDLLPGAKLAKVFNTIGFENLTTAGGRREPAAMFVAGDDPDAKRVAMDLAIELGFVPEDAGGLVNAKALEQMVRVWLALARTHGRGVGFTISKG